MLNVVEGEEVFIKYEGKAWTNSKRFKFYEYMYLQVPTYSKWKKGN